MSEQPPELRSESRFTHGFEAIANTLFKALNDEDLARVVVLGVAEIKRRDTMKATGTEMKSKL